MFEIFSTSGRSDHLVASRNRWVNYQKDRVEQQERLQMSAKKDCDQGVLAGQSCDRLARRKSEVAQRGGEVFIYRYNLLKCSQG